MLVRLTVPVLTVFLLVGGLAAGQQARPTKTSADLAASTVRAAPVDTQQTSRPWRNTAFADLKAKARLDGDVHVIVEVGVNRLGELTRASVDADTAIKAGQEDTRLARAIATSVNRELGNIAGLAHTVKRRFKTLPFVALKVDEATLARLEASPGVVGIQEDELAKPILNNTVDIVGASTTWLDGWDGTGWAVAILDTGVRSSHEFFSTTTITEACFALGEDGAPGAGDCGNGQSVDTSPGAAAPSPSNFDGYDHGTHTSGIAVGNGPGFPAAGVAREANLIHVKIFSAFVGGCGFDCMLSWNSDRVAGLEHVYSLRFTHDIAAVSMSLGGSTLFNNAAACDAQDTASVAVIGNLRAAGIATVAATGNGASCTGINSPACLTPAIAVGATDNGDTEYGGNNYHPTLLDIFAPGVNVLSSVAASDTSYASFSGTSMAAPHAGGAWAILKQAFPNASVDDILLALSNSGVTISGLCGGPVPQTRIQIDAALALLGQNACCQDDGALCTNETPEDCSTLGGKFRPGFFCSQLPDPCSEDVKFSQPPAGASERIASNIDWTDQLPNTVTADDFTSDGRPVRAVRWWGSDIGPVLNEYQLDDGTHENSIGLTGGGDVIWLNQFNVIAGAETINTVSLAWGPLTAGTATTILIYDDPNDDGDPTDAVLLTSFATTSANEDLDIFTTVDVPDTNVGSVGDSFFVGAYVTHGAAQFPASLDQTPPSQGRSWIVGNDPGLADINDLSNNSLPPVIIDVPLPPGGNWLVRADAGPPPIGEPDGWFISFHEPYADNPSTTTPPLGLYFCDNDVVARTDVAAGTCDGGTTVDYRAELDECCLVHATEDTRTLTTPAAADGFHEERCVDYALDVQAVIGHRLESDGGGGCTEVSTGRSTDVDFWAWNTTEQSTGSVYGLGPAASTSVTMSGPDWLYGPWTTTVVSCGDPNMAFELITDEILNGATDGDGDGYPDSCVCAAPATGAVADPAGLRYGRFMPFSVNPPTAAGAKQAIQITLVDLPDFPAFNGEVRWVGPHDEYPDEDVSQPDLTFTGANLSCTPHFADWWTIDLLHAFGGEVIPEGLYEVRIVEDCCEDLGDPSCYSDPLIIEGAVFGDIAPIYAFDLGAPPQPDFNDIAASVDKFLATPGAPSKVAAKLVPNYVFPDRPLDFNGIAASVSAFLAVPYSTISGIFGPCVCSSTVTCGATACGADVVCGDGYCLGGFCTDPCGRCAP